MNKVKIKKETNPQEVLEKAEHFFTAGNFLLAKKAFEQALKLRPDGCLEEKVALCRKEIALQKRKETIKKGRRLEKRGKYSQAIACFEQAAAVLHEVWLEQKITALKEKMRLEEARNRIEAAEASHDPEAALAAYDHATQFANTPELIAKQAAALVRAGRFLDAIQVFSEHPPENDSGYYQLGYALARAGKYVKALAQWHRIDAAIEADQYEKFREQMAALLPFASREMKDGADAQAYGMAYRSTQKLIKTNPSSQLKTYATQFKHHYIATLWQEEAYAEIAPLLEPLPEVMTLPLLGYYARIYYQLAEADPDYLEMAMTFWLTAIYNDGLLKPLLREGLEVDALREVLLQDLQRLIERYDNENRLKDAVRAYWQLEKRLIEQLSSLSTAQTELEIFPATPVFAERFGLTETISKNLNKSKAPSKDEDEALIELKAYYSKACRSLVLMEKGEEEAGLNLLPHKAQDGLISYCRQRICFRLALKKILRGEGQSKRYFREALPLLQKYSTYRNELCELAFSDLKPEASSELAETMEALGKRITDIKFREAVVHVMSVHAMSLERLGGSRAIKSAENLLKRALVLVPESDAVRISLAEIQKSAGFDEMDKALKKQNLSKAVKIIQRLEDPDLTDYFFECIEIYYEDVQTWGAGEKQYALREFHQACLQIDQAHPLTIDIGNDLQRLELP